MNKHMKSLTKHYDEVIKSMTPTIIKNPNRLSLEAIREDDHIWFQGEKQKYTVQCRSPRYLICTKPFNIQNTVLYSVVDLDQMIRGRDDHYSVGYESKEECLRALIGFLTKEVQFSRRFPPIELKVSKIIINPHYKDIK